MRDASFPVLFLTLVDSGKSPFQIATDINFCDEVYSLDAPVLPRASLYGPAAQGSGSLPVVAKLSLAQSILGRVG
jgi:hypothetical protein